MFNFKKNIETYFLKDFSFCLIESNIIREKVLQQIASKYLGLPDLFEDMEKKLGNTTCRL